MGCDYYNLYKEKEKNFNNISISFHSSAFPNGEKKKKNKLLEELNIKIVELNKEIENIKKDGEEQKKSYIKMRRKINF